MMPIAGEQGPPTAICPMLRLLPRLASLVLIVSLPLGMSGCADSLTSKGPIGKFTDLMKSYDKTLTKDQQAATITQLQTEAKQHEGSAPQDATGSAPKAQAQN